MKTLNVKDFPSIKNSQIMTDELMEKIKGGQTNKRGTVCGTGCKKACKPGNMNCSCGN